MKKRRKVKQDKRFSKTSRSSSTQDRARELERAIALHQQGQLDEAVSIYEAILREDPENPDALHLLAHIEYSRGQLEPALARASKAAGLLEKFPFCWNTIGHIRQAMGQLDEAEAAFKRAYAQEPNFVSALQGLGALYLSQQRFDEGAQALREMVQKEPANLNGWIELAGLLQTAGRVAEAEEAYGRLFELDPKHVQSHNNLGVLYMESDRLELAFREFERVLEIDPGYALTYNNLGIAWRKRGDTIKAIEHHNKAIELVPDMPDAYFNIAKIHEASGQVEEAIQAYRRLIRSNPSFIPAYQSIGAFYIAQERWQEADQIYREGLEHAPNGVDYHCLNALAVIYRSCQQLDIAEDFGRKAIAAAEPGNSDPYNTLGWTLHDNGRHEEAEKVFKEALKVDPRSKKVHSNLLFLQTYQLQLGNRELYESSCRFGREQQPEDKHTFPPLTVAMTPYRKLRIAYLSPDFKKHVVRNFIQPIIEHHDRERVEVFCYGEVEHPDEVTEIIASFADCYRNTFGMTDRQAAELMRADGIDVAIELAGHSGGNRLGALMYRPAPVQVAYLGYIATTGVPEVDYRITDHVMNPEDTVELYSEELYRLPRCYKCYEAAPNEPDVNLELSPANRIVFGSLNRISKLPVQTIRLWSRLLEALPECQLMLARHELSYEDNRRKVYAAFAEFNIGPERLILDDTSQYDTHMQIYGKVDIALDPIPVTGGATTAEALWMGCPVLTLQGEAFRERISSSLLTAVGMADWIATSEEEYIEKAKIFAADYEGRLALRKEQRERFRTSELGDFKGLATALEDAYHDVWNRACLKA